MKLIRLHTAACDNGLARHDAGAELSIGDKPHQIAADRAKALIEAGGAIDATPITKPGKAPSLSPTGSTFGCASQPLLEAGKPDPDHTSDEAE